MSEIDEALRALVHAGWMFHWPQDNNGHILLGRAARFHPGGWWDGLVVFDAHHSIAIRIDPDDRQTWRREGPLLDMIHAIDELPPPRQRLAPNLASSTRIPHLWSPGTAQ